MGRKLGGFEVGATVAGGNSEALFAPASVPRRRDPIMLIFAMWRGPKVEDLVAFWEIMCRVDAPRLAPTVRAAKSMAVGRIIVVFWVVCRSPKLPPRFWTVIGGRLLRYCRARS